MSHDFIEFTQLLAEQNDNVGRVLESVARLNNHGVEGIRQVAKIDPDVMLNTLNIMAALLAEIQSTNNELYEEGMNLKDQIDKLKK